MGSQHGLHHGCHWHRYRPLPLLPPPPLRRGHPRWQELQGSRLALPRCRQQGRPPYDEEFQVYLRQNPDKMRLDYALSREGPPNKKGGKMYIQDKVEEYADEVFDALDKGAHMYFCGLKGMMPG